MRNAVLLASLASLVSLVAGTGCLFACGGFEGANNRVYERNSEMLILCGNGGFVAALDTEMLEGRFLENTPGIITATRGDNGQHAFDLDENAGADVLTTGLPGSGSWTRKDLNKVELDHSNSLCNDLQNRDWWTTSAP